MKKILLLLIISWCCSTTVAIPGDNSESPWLVAPVISSDPKVGTSGGMIAGYLHKFDSQSPASIFGVSGNYSNTDSYTTALFTRSYLGADHHRLLAGIASGRINNDYNDYLGTGMPIQTTDDLRFGAARYLYRFDGDWFAGAQLISTNYIISGENALTDKILDLLGLTGFDSSGVGAVLQHDNRNNQESPSHGHFFEVSNMAYRKSLGGDENFDTYGLKYRHYLSHGNGNVVALRGQGRWTSDDTPLAAYSSVDLRGYVRGNYIAPNAISFEAEERFRLATRWAIAAFTGAACLYNGVSDCNDSSNWYPAVGAGMIYTIKPQEQMVVRMDYAQGKQGSNGFYIRFGHPF